jgi:hypothetical protein
MVLEPLWCIAKTKVVIKKLFEKVRLEQMLIDKMLLLIMLLELIFF